MESVGVRLAELFQMALPDVFPEPGAEEPAEVARLSPEEALGGSTGESESGADRNGDGSSPTPDAPDGGAAAAADEVDTTEEGTGTGGGNKAEDNDADKDETMDDADTHPEQPQGSDKDADAAGRLPPEVEEELRLQLVAIEETYSQEASVCDDSVTKLESALREAQNLDESYQTKADELHTTLQRQTSLPPPPSFLDLSDSLIASARLVDSRALLLKWEKHRNALVAPPEAVQFDPDASGGCINTTFVKEDLVDMMPTRFERPTLESLTSPRPSKASMGKTTRQRGELLPTQFVGPKWKHGDRMSAAQHELEFKLLKKMQERLQYIRNPRFEDITTIQKRASLMPSRALLTSSKDIDVVVEPSVIRFASYQVGSVHETHVTLRNVSTVSRRLRLLPIESEYFSIDKVLFPSSNGYVAPGMHCRATIKFMPDSLGDYEAKLTVITDIRRYKVDIVAHRESPKLSLEPSIDLGKCLVGHKMRTVISVSNRGGDGTFVIMSKEQLVEHEERSSAAGGALSDTHAWLTTMARGTRSTTTTTSPPRATRQAGIEDCAIEGDAHVCFGDDDVFTVSPSCFHLRKGDTTDILVDFEPTGTGSFEADVPILSDDCKVTHVVLHADAVNVTVRVADISDRRVVSASQDAAVEDVWFGDVSPYDAVARRVTVENTTPIDLPFQWRAYEVPLPGYRSIMQQSADDIDAGRVTKDGDVFRVVPSDGVLSAGASFDFDFYFSPNSAEAAERAAPGAGHSYKQIMRMFVDTELGFGGCLIKQTDDMSRAITRRSLPVSSSCVDDDDDDDDDDACPLPLHVPCVAVPVEGRGVHYDVHLSQSLVRFCGEVRVGELYSKTIQIVNESRVPASFSIPEDPTSEVQYSPRTGEVPAFGSVAVCITVSPNRARGRSGDKDRVSVVKRSIEISDGNVLSLVTTYSVAPLVLTFGEVMLNLDNIKLNRTKSTALYMRNDNAVAIDYYIRCDHPDVTIDENEATGTLPPNSDYETVNVTVFGHTVGTLEDVITVRVAMSEKDTDRGGDDNGGLSEQSVCDRCDNIQQMGLLATVFAPRLILDRYVVDIGLTYVGEVRRRRVKIKNVAKVSSHYEWVVPETNRIREPGNEDDDGTGGSISGASVIECSPQHGYLLGGEVEELKLTVRAGSLCGVFEVPIECAIDETDQVLGIVLRMRVQPIEVRFSVLDAENRLNAFRRTTAGVVGGAESSSGVRIAETDERRGEGGDIALDDDDEEEENTGDNAASLSASAKESGGNQSVAINFGSVCRVGERYEMYLAVENLTKVKTGLTLDLEDYGTAYPGTTSMLSNTKTMVSVSKATAALPTERLEASTASSITLGMSNNNSRNTLSPSLRPLSKSLGASRRTMTHHMQQQQQSIRLGAAHERAAPFSCELGKSLMRHRVTRSDDCEALGDGKGLAIALCVLHEQDIVGLCDAEEANAPKGRGGDERELHELLPRRSVLVRLTCFCSMPGEYVTSLGVRVGNLPPIPVPIRIGVVGTPVELRRERRAVAGYSSLQSHRSFTSLSFGSAWARSRVSRSFHVANTSSFDLEVRFCLKYKQEVLATSGEKKLAVLKLNVIADDVQNGKSRGEKVQVKLKENIDEDVREFSVYPERLELLAGGEACVTAHFSSDEAGDFEATIFGEQRVINKNSQLKLKLWHNQEQRSEGDRLAESGDASGDSSAEMAPDTDAKSDTVSVSGPSPPPAPISAIIMGGFHAYAGVPVRPLDTLKLDLHAMAVSQHLDVEDSLDFFTQSIHAIHHPSLLQRVTLTNNFSTAVTFALRIEGEFFSIDEAVASVEQRIRATSSTLVPGDPSQAGMLFELPPHQNVEVACRFRPSAVDGHNDYTVEGKLLVDFGTLASVQTLPIRASVCHPALEVVGASVTDFGTVHCESSRTLTITLSNPTKADATWRIVNSGGGEMTSSSHHQHNGSSSLTTTLTSESDDLGVSFGSGTGSSSAPGFSVWPSHGVVKGNSIYGQITTTSLKVTFRPSTTATTTKLLRVVVSKGRGCEIVLKGSGTYDERIEAIVL